MAENELYNVYNSVDSATAGRYLYPLPEQAEIEQGIEMTGVGHGPEYDHSPAFMPGLQQLNVYDNQPILFQPALPTTTTVVMPYQSPIHEKPETFMLPAILATLFCCCPFGIAAILNASAVNQAYESGDYSKAQSNSVSARNWTITACATGAAICVITIITIVLIHMHIAPIIR